MSRLLNTPRRKPIKPPKFIIPKECKECVIYRYSSSPVLSRITVPFFGGFLGAIVVASIKYLFGLFALTYPLLNSFQLIQNFSWGGAMWAFIPAVFLLLRKGNIYAIALLTTSVAFTFEIFVLQSLPFSLTSTIIVSYAISLVYALILAITIKVARFR
jgi:hypothetical protein